MHINNTFKNLLKKHYKLKSLYVQISYLIGLTLLIFFGKLQLVGGVIGICFSIMVRRKLRLHYQKGRWLALGASFVRRLLVGLFQGP